MDKEFVALYTHQKQKKAKTWHDGVVKHSGHGNKAVLYDDKGGRLDSIYIKVEDLIVGEQIESDRYLILIEELKKTPTNTSVTHSANVAVTKIPTIPSRPQSRARCAGLKRKKSGFVPPRMIQQTSGDPGDNNSFSNSQPTLADRPQFLPGNKPSFYSQIQGTHRSPTLCQPENVNTLGLESSESEQGHVQTMFSSSLASSSGRPHQNMLNMYSKVGKAGDSSDNSVNSSQSLVCEDREKLMSPKPMSPWSVYGSNNSSPSLSQLLNNPPTANRTEGLSPKSEISSPDFLFAQEKPYKKQQELANTQDEIPKHDTGNPASLFGQAEATATKQQPERTNILVLCPKSDFSSPASLFGQTNVKAFSQQQDYTKTDESPKSDTSSQVSLFGQAKSLSHNQTPNCDQISDTTPQRDSSISVSLFCQTKVYSQQKECPKIYGNTSTVEKSQLNPMQGVSRDVDRQNVEIKTEVKQKRNMSQIMNLLKRKKTNPDTTNQKFVSTGVTEPKGSVIPVASKLVNSERKENYFDRYGCDENASELNVNNKKLEQSKTGMSLQNAQRHIKDVMREVRNPFDIQKQPRAQPILQELVAPSKSQESLLSSNVPKEKRSTGSDLQENQGQSPSIDNINNPNKVQGELEAESETSGNLDEQIVMQEGGMSQANTKKVFTSQSGTEDGCLAEKVEAEIDMQGEPIDQSKEDLITQEDIVPQTDSIHEVLGQAETGEEFIAHIHTSGKIAIHNAGRENLIARPLSQEDIVPQSDTKDGLVSEAGSTTQEKLNTHSYTPTENIAKCHAEKDSLDQMHSRVDQPTEPFNQELTAKSDSQENNSFPSNTKCEAVIEEVLDDSFGCFDLVLSPADLAGESDGDYVETVSSRDADKQLKKKGSADVLNEQSSMNVNASENDTNEKQSDDTPTSGNSNGKKRSQCNTKIEVKNIELNCKRMRNEGQKDDAFSIQTLSVIPQLEKDYDSATATVVENIQGHYLKTNLEKAVTVCGDFDTATGVENEQGNDPKTKFEEAVVRSEDVDSAAVVENKQGNDLKTNLEKVATTGEDWDSQGTCMTQDTMDFSCDTVSECSQGLGESSTLYGKQVEDNNSSKDDNASAGHFGIAEPLHSCDVNRNNASQASNDKRLFEQIQNWEITGMENLYGESKNYSGRAINDVTSVNHGNIENFTDGQRDARSRLDFRYSLTPDMEINQPATWMNRTDTTVHKPVGKMDRAEINISTSVSESNRPIGDTHTGHIIEDSVLSANHQQSREQFNLLSKMHRKSPGSEGMDRWQKLQDQFSADNFGESLEEEDPLCISSDSRDSQSGAKQTSELQDLSSAIKDRLQSYERSTCVRSMSVRRPTGDAFKADRAASPGDYTQHKSDFNKSPSLGMGTALEPKSFVFEESQEVSETDSPYQPCPRFLQSPSPDSTQHQIHQFQPNITLNPSEQFTISRPCLKTPSLDSSQEDDEIYNRVYRRPMFPSGCKGDQNLQLDLQPMMYKSPQDNLTQILKPAQLNQQQQSPSFFAKYLESPQLSTSSNSPVNNFSRLRNDKAVFQGEREIHPPNTDNVRMINSHQVNDKSYEILTYSKNESYLYQDAIILSSESVSDNSQQSAFNCEDKENAFGRMPNAFSSASKLHLPPKGPHIDSEGTLDCKVDYSECKQAQEDLVGRGSKWEDYMPSDASDDEGIDLHKFKDDSKGTRDYSVLEKPAELVAKLEEMKQAKLNELKQTKMEEVQQARLEEMKQAKIYEMKQVQLEESKHAAEVTYKQGLNKKRIDEIEQLEIKEANQADIRLADEMTNTSVEPDDILDNAPAMTRTLQKCSQDLQCDAHFDLPSSFASADSFDELVAKENVDLIIPSKNVANNVLNLRKDAKHEHNVEGSEEIESIPDNDIQALKGDFDPDRHVTAFTDKDMGPEGCEETNNFCDSKDSLIDEVSSRSVTQASLPMSISKHDQVNKQNDIELVEDQKSTHSSPFSIVSSAGSSTLDKARPSHSLKNSRLDPSEQCDMQQDLDESLVLSPPEFSRFTTEEPVTKPKSVVPSFGSNLRKVPVKTAASAGLAQTVESHSKPAQNSRCLKLLTELKTAQGSSESFDFSIDTESVAEKSTEIDKVNANFVPVTCGSKSNCDKLSVRQTCGSDPKVGNNGVGISRRVPDFSIPVNVSSRMAAGEAGYKSRSGYQPPTTEVAMVTTHPPADVANRSPVNSQSAANKKFKAPSLVQPRGREERKYGSAASPSITASPVIGATSVGNTQSVSSTQLHFPCRSLVDQLQNVARQVVIPDRFPSVNTYKQVLIAAVTEYINTQLLEVAKRYHNALSRVDTSGYTQVSAASGASPSSAGTPRCQCGAQSKMVMVRKQGANQGRYFYTCSAARNQQCKFFQWADDNTKEGYNKGGGGSRRVIKDTRTLGLHMKDSGVHFYGESQLAVRTKENISRYFKAPKWVRARADPEVMQKKQMVLKIPYKGHSSLYAKDDLWIVSKSLEFDAGSTFIAKSTYHGPTAGQEVEIEPIVGYSPSNWPNDSVCHGILAGNVSSELSCIDNIKEHLQHTSPPIVTQLLNRKGEETADRGKANYQAPRMTVGSRNNSGFLLPSEHMDMLSHEYIKKYKLNIDQAEAVRRVACMFSAEKAGQLDDILLIHGVFGAGKSFLLSVVVLFLVTVFEHISQVLQYPGDTQWKLLISSTTNVAVDRILNGLLDLGFEDFVRVGSVKKIAKSVLPYSVHATGTDSQELKDLQEMLRSGELTASEKSNVRKSIEKHRCGENKKKLSKVMVVGATCAACSLSCLNNMEFPLVLLDECSQMTEPASLLPIARFSCQKLILVGDPKQLAPTIQSVDAAHSQGLEQTMFDRLLKMGHMPTLLRTQYRCHPCISAMANKLFYGGMLQDGVTDEDRQPLLPCLPTLCLFTVEVGRESCERAGSYYNEAEAQLVVSLLQTLVSSGLEPATLGVITLYRAQVARITDLLMVDSGDGELKGVQVSTVDAFQGGEKDVIILSCVRTNNCGFLESDKRMNVALTRARHHLFIVGHHGNLSTSMLWGKVIDHCKGFENGVLSEAEAKSLMERRLESPATRSQHSSSSQASDTSDKPDKKRGRKRKSAKDTSPIQNSAESLDTQNTSNKRRRVPRPRQRGTDSVDIPESSDRSPLIAMDDMESRTTDGQGCMEEDSQASEPLMCSEGSIVDLVKDSTALDREAKAKSAPGGRHRCTDSLDAITFDSDNDENNDDSDSDLPAFSCGKV